VISTRIASCVLAFTLAAPCALAETFVVDGSGGGDFSTIQAAINAAAPGDVLKVMAGNYAGFTLGKDLAILGAPDAYPTVTGFAVLQGDSMRIAGLRFFALEVLDAEGFVLLDDVRVQVGTCGGMLVENCAQVHIERSSIDGLDGTPSCESVGLKVVDSTVTLTSSIVTGGTGWGDDFTGYNGMPGLDVRGTSSVLLAGTDVIGGNGGTPEILFGGSGGWGAEAILLNWGDLSGSATCTVRGNLSTEIRGGVAGQGIGGQDASAAVLGHGPLTISGVSLSPANFGPGLTVEVPSPAQPFIHLAGADEPGAFKRLSLFGPANQPLLVFASLATAQLSAPGPVDGTIWLDPGAPLLILPFTFVGQQSSQNFTFSLPAQLTGLEGLVVTFQGFASGMGATGNHLASNPAHLLVR
jgi:hypothetical protein